MNYQNLFQGIQKIRQFFYQDQFLEIFAPPMVEHPGFDPHIHPFQLYSAHNKKKLPYYLQTSPEFTMKKILSEGEQKIFTITHAFRDEPSSPIHRPQFLMLEWYRANAHYTSIQEDIKNLYYAVSNNKNIQFSTVTTQELFVEVLKIDWKNFLDFSDFYQLILKDFPQIPLPKKESLSWEDCFFLIFLNLIEPELKRIPALILTEYPASLSALSTIKESDPSVCERFECYLDGIEVANCFNELIDYKKQKARWSEQRKQKKQLYHYDLPRPTVLLQSLQKGLPPSAGIALGIERFLSITLGMNKTFVD